MRVRRQEHGQTRRLFRILRHGLTNRAIWTTKATGSTREKAMSDLERVTQAQANSALTGQDSSSRRSLSTEEFSTLVGEVELLITRYPSQDQEQSIEVYLADFERLALKYSLRKVQNALAALRIRAGQKFFPRPDEVAQEIEDQREAGLRRAQVRDGNAWLRDWKEHVKRVTEERNAEDAA
jgi:hypothetical protein